MKELQKVTASMREASNRLAEGDHGDLPVGDLLAEILDLSARLTEKISVLAERINKSVGDDGR